MPYIFESLAKAKEDIGSEMEVALAFVWKTYLSSVVAPVKVGEGETVIQSCLAMELPKGEAIVFSQEEVKHLLKVLDVWLEDAIETDAQRKSDLEKNRFLN